MENNTANQYFVYNDGGYEESFATEAEAIADVQRLATIGIRATWFKK